MPEDPHLTDWKENILDPALSKAAESKKEFRTSSGIEVDRIGVPADLDDGYLSSLGLPGAFPFTRGIHPTMYRSRHWTMRQYAGFGTAMESNQRYRELLAKGGKGLSVAFDLPTQIGLDSDHPLSQGEVGKVGVAIDSLADMETLFEGIPLERVSTSMTINAPAFALIAMYAVVGEKQGVDWKELRGTIQNDILKEYLSRGTYIYPPAPSMELTGELIAWCSRELPRFNPISISGYHIREAGSTAPQEIAFTLSNAIAYLDTAIARGLSVDEVAPRFSFFFNSASDLFEEVAKFRAARRMWARIVRDRFGARKAESMLLRFHAQTAGHTLTAQQIDNNVSRVTLQALAAVLGGAQSLHTNAKDEALALPSAENAETALRVQQVIAHESGVANSVDPLGGSFFVENLTDKMEIAAMDIMDTVEKMGGSVKAIEAGSIQRLIDEAAFEQQNSIDREERVIVGVNAFESDVSASHETTAAVERASTTDAQRKALEMAKRRRNSEMASASLVALEKAAKNGEPIMPLVVEAVRAYSTVGEICDTLRRVYGEHRSEFSTY